jgi:hypothetical protein
MDTLRRWIVMVGILCGLLLPQAALAAPVTSVQPAAGPPGTSFLFFASGFAANERVGIWLNAPNGQIVPASAPELRHTNAYGDASWAWTAPGDAIEGGWQMVIYGIQSTLTQVIPFTIGQVAPPAGMDQPSGVAPANGVAGTLFRFYATGFEFREPIGVAVRGPSGPLEDAIVSTPSAAGPEGRIDGSWASPADAAPGLWQIVVRGLNSHVERTIAITIDPAPAAAPAQLSVSPSSGARGARFVFSAAGFKADEHISVWLNLPNGQVREAQIEGRAQAGPDGHAGWGWVAPSDAPLGTWQMVAHGRDSGIEVVATFVVQ